MKIVFFIVNQNFITKIRFRLLFSFFFFSCFTIFSQSPDFRTQHLQDDIGNTGGINNTFTAVGSINSAIELANNNRKVHAGNSGNAGNLEGNDMSGSRQLTSNNTLTYYRQSGSVNRDMRFNTSLWEYIGPVGGDNEFIVRGRYTINLNGATNSVTQALSGVINAERCIPFITGILNSTTGDDADSATALAYLENSTTLRIEKGSNGNNVTVYITVVEFTGVNWTVLHGDSGNTGLDDGSIILRDGSNGTGTVTNVSDWSEAIIFSHFRGDTNASGINDAIADLWPVVEPGSDNQTVNWDFDFDHDSSGLNRHFVHVLVNSGLNVTRFQNYDDSVGEVTIDITSAGLSDVNQALIVGSSRSNGGGTAYGRGWRNYYLNSVTEAAHWSHRSGNSRIEHEIQIVDLAGLTTIYPGPEINIQGNGVTIPNGNTTISTSDNTDFGSIEVSSGLSVAHTFTIQNLGDTDLILDDPSPYIVITGDTSDFTLTALPTTPITALGGSTTFEITFSPTAAGPRLVTVSISNSDSDENPYTFNIEGEGEYCPSTGNTIYNTSITLVNFNTINNADNEIPKDNSYEDFTSISTSVYRNSTHNLTVNVNTDGNYTNYTFAWIDWNQDGDFNDTSEEYNLGTATNVSDGPTANSPFAITVPSFAAYGAIRMRIVTKYGSEPTTCETGFDGEVEDYTINVVEYKVDFDGVDDFIEFGDEHDLTGNFSLEAWILQETLTSTATIISNGTIGASWNSGYHLTLNNGYPNLIWYDNSNNEIINILSPFQIPVGEWHHIAVTYNSSEAIIYVDGIEVISGSTTIPPADTLQNFKIGAEMFDYWTSPTNANFFNGAIQEVRIWDVALTYVQIQEMMNQGIEDNSGNVRGLIIPIDISGGLLWTNLRGYYPLNAGTAFDSSDYGIDGTPNNVTTQQPITAPLPYETENNGIWDTSGTWLNGVDLYIPNTVGVDGSTSIDWNIVELSHNISSGDRDIILLGLISNNGILTIADPTVASPIEDNNGQSLTITNYLELDGVIDLVGESQLIQNEGSILDADSGGYIERDQQGTANSFNYNYWTSSVSIMSTTGIGTRGTGVAATNTGYTLEDVMFDGTDSSNPSLITYNSSYTAADSGPTSPITKSSYWLWKFNGANDDYDAWIKIEQSTLLEAGEGFTMKGSLGSTPVTDEQNYVFIGMPNNGDVSLPIAAGNDRLIGNPYPSAIDANEFILDNISDSGGRASANVINGALYFWHHFGEEDTHYLSGYVGGYATYNLTGGVEAYADDARINATGASGGTIPERYIPVNQGFFVLATDDGITNIISPITGGDIIFKNSQRVFRREGVTGTNDGSVFLKTTKKSKSNSEIETEVETRAKIWLQFESPNGFYRQLLLGVDKNASSGFDLGYDALIADRNKEDMFWLIEGGEYVIQGVDNFNKSKEISLGLITEKEGVVKIKIDRTLNIDESTPLYIKDNLTGETYNIKEQPFEIELEAGEYLNRFSLAFQPRLKTLEEVTLNKGIFSYMNNDTSEIYVRKIVDTEITNIQLFNYLGQEVQRWTGKYLSREFMLPVNVITGVYILQINTENGFMTKKIVVE